MASSPTSVRAGNGYAAALLAPVLGAAAMGIPPVLVRAANADAGPFARAFRPVCLALPVLHAWMGISTARPNREAP
jgi:hypothetical protein